MLWYLMCLFLFFSDGDTLNRDGPMTSDDPFVSVPDVQDTRFAYQSSFQSSYQSSYQSAFQSSYQSSDQYKSPCQNCGCGERNGQTRVVGGLGLSSNAFPWLARVIYHTSFGCGASVLNDRYVISAAHCIKGFMWFMFKVTFGEHERCHRTERPVTRYVVKMIVHNFTLSDLSNDVSLLKLNEPLTYSHIIRPVCLPRNPANTYVSATAIVAGWGATSEGGKWSCLPLEASLPVLSNVDCRNTKYNASKIKDVMLCAGYPNTAHKDGCTGDSGGPLVTLNEKRVHELIGIVSWGYGCARKGYPGVYTRVTKYLNWIRDNTDDACYCD